MVSNWAINNDGEFTKNSLANFTKYHHNISIINLIPQMLMSRNSPNCPSLPLDNGSCLQVDLHRLNDGGHLVIFGGTSYTTHMKEEITGYRVVIGGKTCMFEKDNDPTVIRSVCHDPSNLVTIIIFNCKLSIKF